MFRHMSLVIFLFRIILFSYCISNFSFPGIILKMKKVIITLPQVFYLLKEIILF